MAIKAKAGRTDAARVYGLALKRNSQIRLAARPGRICLRLFVTSVETLSESAGSRSYAKRITS